MTATLALVRGRLRPVPWGWLAVLVAGWLLLTDRLVNALGDPDIGVAVFRWAAFLLGLGGAVLIAPETDPPHEVLRAAPIPMWRALAVRLGGWLLLGGLAVVALAAQLDNPAGGWTAADLARGALPNFLLVTAVCFLAARATSVLGGGAAAIAVVVALHLAGRAWPGWFPIQLGSVPGGPHWQASRAWMVALSLALVALALLAERRSGGRLALPRRRHPTTRPSPASQAKSRP
jgi:hypothetical protein